MPFYDTKLSASLSFGEGEAQRPNTLRQKVTEARSSSVWLSKAEAHVWTNTHWGEPIAPRRDAGQSNWEMSGEL